jgi:hypothetical protein
MAEVIFNRGPAPDAPIPRARAGEIAVVQQAMAVLRAGVGAKVAELIAYVTSEYPDLLPPGPGFRVPQDDAWFNYLRLPLKCPSYPTVCIVPYPAKMLNHSIQDEYKDQRTFVVDVVCQGTSPEDLTLQLQLWELLVFELLGNTEAMDCGHTIWTETAWAKPLQTIASLSSLVADLPMLFVTTMYEYPDPNV